MGTVGGRFGAFGHPGGKDQASGSAALPAVGLRKQFEDLDQIGFGQPLVTGFNLVTLCPGGIDLPLEPIDDLACFVFILQGVYGDFSTADGYQFSMGPGR